MQVPTMAMIWSGTWCKWITLLLVL